MIEHTPGPWRTVAAHIGNENDFGIAAQIDGTERIIAECYGVVGPNVLAPATANANLIATAPDMLAALEMGHYNLTGPELLREVAALCDRQGWSLVAENLRAKADAEEEAIRKARGGHRAP